MDNVFCQIKFNCNRLSKRRLNNKEHTGKGSKLSMFIETRKLVTVSIVGSLALLWHCYLVIIDWHMLTSTLTLLHLRKFDNNKCQNIT
jgi:hypothetical protein